MANLHNNMLTVWGNDIFFYPSITPLCGLEIKKISLKKLAANFTFRIYRNELVARKGRKLYDLIPKTA